MNGDEVSAFLLAADAENYAAESGGEVATFKDLLQTYAASGPQRSRISRITPERLRDALNAVIPAFAG